MIYAFVWLAMIVALSALALRALILGVSEHLEADDMPPFRHAAVRRSIRVRRSRVGPARVGVGTQRRVVAGDAL